MHEQNRRFLLCRVGELVCALPLEDVEETMRPLAVEPLAGVPPFVRGLAVVRGSPIPVVDAAALLLDGDTSPATRFVTIKVGARRVALAVGAVVGIVEIPLDATNALPPLLHDAGLDAIAAIGRLDADLLLVLQGTRLVSDDVLTLVHSGTSGPA
jgi:purine-binding chemotaxis protein CheW